MGVNNPEIHQRLVCRLILADNRNGFLVFFGGPGKFPLRKEPLPLMNDSVGIILFLKVLYRGTAGKGEKN